MAPAMAVEDLLAAEGELDRPAVPPGEEAGGEVMGERLALAAKAAAHRRHDDAQAAPRHLQHLGDLAVDVVRRLRRGPEGDLAIGAAVGDAGVLLHRRVGGALEEVGIFADQIGLLEALFDRRQTPGGLLS